MKFSYDFKLSEHSGSSRVYVCGDITARIDFLSGSMMRVALFRDDCKMLPTFTVDPQNEFLTEGRDKLSLDGFSLFAPQVNEKPMVSASIWEMSKQSLIRTTLY